MSNQTYEMELSYGDFDVNVVSDNEEVNQYQSISDAFLECRRKFHAVDIGYIAYHSKSEPKTVIKTLEGKAIFQDPAYFADKFCLNPEEGWVFREQYLSGFLPDKLKLAEQMNRSFMGRFTINISELKGLLAEYEDPENLEITIGSPFIPCDIYADFMVFLLRLRHRPVVRFNRIKNIFEIKVTDQDDMNTIRHNKLYSTFRMSALEIIVKTMNAATLKVYDERMDYYGKKNRIFNATETLLVQEIQQRIIKAFREYIEASSVRFNRILEAYKKRFTGFYNASFEGSYLDFPDLDPKIHLYAHQKNSIARVLESDQNVLLSHKVGAGKTYVIVCSVHELYRTGQSKKNLVVVPNNILQDFETAHRKLYSGDHILVVTPAMFTLKNRTRVLEEIRDGDYVAIYMAFSSFNMLKMSKDHKTRMMSKEISELRAAAANASTKTEENSLMKIADTLSRKLYDFMTEYQDPEWQCFDELGIQTLFIDEAHNYKNISIKTRADGIVGMHGKGSACADEALEKVHYVDRTVFSTGTPLCNSLADLFTLMTYLQPEQLRFRNIHTFDMWINTFGERVSDYELDVAHKLRAITRFSSFHNLNELMGMFGLVCDFCDDVADVPVSAKYEDVDVEITPEQAEFIKKLGERVEMIRQHKVKRTIDNLLKVTSDGRLCALDGRLVGLSDSKKVVACADKISDFYRRFPNRTQAVFSDIGTPKSGFNIYDSLRYELVQRGIPWNEIAFVHTANTEKKRLKLFEDVNEGRIKVIIGSTEKLGTGVNIQKNLVALHHLSVPWRPSDLEQREGRILRQGNECGEVFILRYITEGTFDGYLWQLLENKQRFIASFLTGVATSDKADDIADTVLTYAEIKALAIGNPLIKKRVETANRIDHLRINSHQREKELSELKKIIEFLPDKMNRQKQIITVTESDAAGYQANRQRITIEERTAFGEELIDALRDNVEKSYPRIFDTYQSFEVELPKDMDKDKPYVNLVSVNGGRYYVEMTCDKPLGCAQRLDILLDRLPERVEEQRLHLSQMRRQLKDARANYSLGNPYPDQIDALESELRHIDKQLEESEAA